jgi:hypothetical protein
MTSEQTKCNQNIIHFIINEIENQDIRAILDIISMHLSQEEWKALRIDIDSNGNTPLLNLLKSYNFNEKDSPKKIREIILSKNEDYPMNWDKTTWIKTGSSSEEFFDFLDVFLTNNLPQHKRTTKHQTY